MVHLPAARLRSVLVAASSLVLTSCGGGGGGYGGGGGGGGGATFSVDAHSLTYSASSPSAATPASQTVTGTVTGSLSGTLYIVVDVAGTAVASVSNFAVSGNSGQANVSVQAPSALGIGTFTSTLTVHACLNDSTCATGELSGSPQLVNVSYTISGPPLADTVMPHAVAAGLAGTVVLRGSGFTGTTGVSFGATPATAFTVDSDTLIHASYPATLSAGTLAVTLTGSQAVFSGEVIAVGPEAYAATTLTYPSAPQRIAAAVFDAQRQVLYVAAVFATTSTNQIWAYSYSGGAWSAPAAIGVSDLTDLTLSADGSQLFALTLTSVETFDASNPGGSAPVIVTAPFATGMAGGSILLHFALANDGNLLLETGLVSASVGDSYLFSIGSGTFTDLQSDSFNTQLAYSSNGTAASLGASPDGSLLVAAQWQYPSNSPPTGFGYTAASGIVGPFVVPANQIPDQPLAFNTNATEIAVAGGGYSYVVDGTATITGRLSSLAPIRVDIINPQGTRAYELHGDATLHTFDLTATPSGTPAAYPEIGAGVAQTVPTVTSQTLRTAVTPDGKTLFIAGDAGVAVIPAPN